MDNFPPSNVLSLSLGPLMDCWSPFGVTMMDHFYLEATICTTIVGLYPEGSPSRNSRRPGSSPGLRGGLEIVFNQQ
ncbi:uncharacterized protein LOC110416922 [Herrania umbratica]|uniref:Uncharacterized protein LOC110416922 n=1 Tax=Herrania umbratica TaxID=108875 RepID=A0A6J1AD46_9ROSI|nr:uncharacterized protein LOC110416922 [Herrania umbratica]